MTKVKIRVFPEHNYKGVYFDGKTVRLALDPSKPITELKYPEFLDIKITDTCRGRCPYCYMDSTPDAERYIDVYDKIKDYFGPLSANERPFQVAIGGGEPTESNAFYDSLRAFDELGITPNYTTNGMFIDKSATVVSDILKHTKKYCGGVAVSCHPHLDHYWTEAAAMFSDNDIKLNFHIIISDPASADRFRSIYDIWYKSVDYFVLLPYGSQGRAAHKEIDWEYLVSVMPKDTSKIAFGANFHPYLVEDKDKFNVSLYEPESMSKFLDLKDMKLYPSSFHLEPIEGV